MRKFQFTGGGFLLLTVEAADLEAAKHKAACALSCCTELPSGWGVTLELASSEIAIGDDSNWREIDAEA